MTWVNRRKGWRMTFSSLPTLPSLYLRHSSFTNRSVASPSPQFILQPFFGFSYVTSSSFNSPGEPPMSSFSNIFVTTPTAQLILQPFRRFTYVTAHSPTLPLLHLRHSSFSNPSFASPTSQAQPPMLNISITWTCTLLGPYSIEPAVLS